MILEWGWRVRPGSHRFKGGPIFDIPEVDFKYSVRLYGRVLTGEDALLPCTVIY